MSRIEFIVNYLFYFGTKYFQEKKNILLLFDCQIGTQLLYTQIMITKLLEGSDKYYKSCSISNETKDGMLFTITKTKYYNQIKRVHFTLNKRK